MSNHSPIAPPPELVGLTDEALLDLADDSGLDRFEGERSCPGGTVIKEGCWEAWDHQLLAFARALLNQPVAKGPTDDEIEEWADACPEAPIEEMDPEVHGWRRCFTAKEFSETIRAALARWGCPTPLPVELAPLDKLDRLIALDRDNPIPEATNE